jgi:hypothetical protein
MPDLDPVTILLGYLAIGAVIWAFNDPHGYRDFAIRAFVRRTGRVPGNGFVVAAVLLAIVVWPWLTYRGVKTRWGTVR